MALQTLRDNMDKAYAKFKGTWVEPKPKEGEGDIPAWFQAPDYIADDTREGKAPFPGQAAWEAGLACFWLLAREASKS